MKRITIAFAATSLLALAACNQDAGNNTAADANAAATAVDANAAAPGNTADGAKPAGDAAATGNEAAAPAGDKPAADASAPTEAPAEGNSGGDKPPQ